MYTVVQDTKITFYLESSGGQSLNLYLNVVHFFNTCVNWHLWQLKKVFSAIGNILGYLKNLYLESSGGQNSNLYSNVVHFSMPVLIRHWWHLKTVVFLYNCLMHALLCSHAKEDCLEDAALYNLLVVSPRLAVHSNSCLFERAYEQG